MLGLASITTSCGDATAPRSYSPSYALTNVDGQSVPAEVVSIPGTLSITDVSGTLSLNPDGSAVVLTHIHRVDASTGTLDYDQIDSVDYRIHGDSIEVGIFGPWTVTLTPKQTPRLPPILRYDVEAEVLN
jgi:hypothetical protein